MAWKAPRGFDPVKERARELEEGDKRRKRLVREFFLKPDEEATVRFLIEPPAEPASVYLHNRQMISKKGREFWQRLVCLKNIDLQARCPYCDILGSPSLQAHFTIVDKREWTEETMDDRGRPQLVKHKDEKKVWRVGVRAAQLIEKMTARWGSITASDVIVMRIGGGQSTTYSLERAENKHLPDCDPSPFNWDELLCPPTLEEACSDMGLSIGEYAAEDVPPPEE